MRKITIFAFLSLASVCTAAQLCVTVSDPVNLPVGRAWVVVANLSNTEKRFTATTDKNGKACIKAIPEGAYSVEAGAVGFMNVRYYPLRIQPVRDGELTFRLPIGEIREGGIHEDAVLTGTIRSPDNPSPHARICLLQKADEGVVSCTIADEIGQFAISVPPGRYIVEVTERDQRPVRREIDLTRRGIHRKKLLDNTNE